MNYVLIGLVAAVIIILALVFKKFMIIIGLAILQYLANPLSDRLKLNLIPFFEFDQELSNLIVAFVTYFMGIKYGFCFLIMAVAAHMLRLQWEDLLSLLEVFIEGFITLVLIFFIAPFGWIVAIPTSIIAAKIFYDTILVIFFGEPLYSIEIIRDITAIAIYVITFRML